jgi:deoxyribodipyrimidine photo-lyase
MLPAMQTTSSRIFEPTRAAGLARLAAFVPSAGRHYAASRNDDLGPDKRSNVSVLSPYIRHRLITEEEVLAAVLAQHSQSAAEKFIQEVFWRTYFKGHLETRPVIWSNYRHNLDQQIDGLLAKGSFRKHYERAVEGRTGIDCFDAWVEELAEIGYLHNHTRMWFASIWIFTLRLPWELGADFMIRHLIDGDPASNTLSWRWVGGLHTRGKTYLARPDNIRSCTHDRFSPEGLAREAPPLEEPPLPSARPLPAAKVQLPSGRIGLLLTPEDLHPASLDRGDADIVAVAGAVLHDALSSLETSDRVKAFTDGALADALLSASTDFSAPATHLPSLSALAIEDWARRHALETVVTAYAPVGPVATCLAEITPLLQAKGIRLVQVRRAFDTLGWPHGTRGFFAMKEKIPAMIRELGMGPSADDPQLMLFS